MIDICCFLPETVKTILNEPLYLPPHLLDCNEESPSLDMSNRKHRVSKTDSRKNFLFVNLFQQQQTIETKFAFGL